MRVAAAVSLPQSPALGRVPRKQAAPGGIAPHRRPSAVVVLAAAGTGRSLGQRQQQQQQLRRRPLHVSPPPALSPPRLVVGPRRVSSSSSASPRAGRDCGHSHDESESEHSHAEHSHGCSSSHDHEEEEDRAGSSSSCCSSSSSSSCDADADEDGHGHGHHHHHGSSSSPKLPRGAAECLARRLSEALGLSALARRLSHSVPALAAAAAALLLAGGIDYFCASSSSSSSYSSVSSSPSSLPLLLLLPRLKLLLAAAAYVLAGLPDLLELSYTLLAALPRRGSAPPLSFLFPVGLGQGPLAALRRVDTHSLMSASAAAAALLGSPLEGALLLVLFGLSHALESRLARRAKGDLRGLLASSPPSAVLVEMTKGPEGGAGGGGERATGEGERETEQPDFSSARVVAASDVRVGQVSLVRPGEACAHDGLVRWGTALVSAEHITGEALPRRARRGDALPAGAVSRDGALAVECTAAARDSAPARIAALAAAAQRSRPPLAAWLDEVGAVYSRAVLVASLGAFLGLLALGVPLGSGSSVAAATGATAAAAAASTRGAAYRAMALLTAASPCALALAPLAYVAAVAAAARRGVVLRGGGATLDALLAVRGVGLDKTGTLTTGELRCVGQVMVRGQGEEEEKGASSSSSASSLATAAALALRSTHPVSAALVAAAKGAGVEPLAPAALSAFELVPGSGVRARLLPLSPPPSSSAAASPSSSAGDDGGEAEARDSGTVLLGSADWVAAAIAAESKGRGASAAASAALLAAAAETEAGAVIVSAFARIPSPSPDPSSPPPPPPEISLFAFEDAVRGLSSSAVASLRSGGGGGSGSGGSSDREKKNRRPRRPPLSLRVLTGDNAASASRVARSLGLAAEDLRSGLSPEGKVDALRELREQVNRDDDAKGEEGSKRGRRFGVMMVGDGVNDAPALAAADVGVALSSSTSSPSSSSPGTETGSTTATTTATTTTAQELAADVLLLGGAGIEQLPFLLDLAALTRRVVAQNLAVAAGSVAVLSLPALCGFLPLWLAVALHEGSTLVVALNSLRPLAFRGEKEKEKGAKGEKERKNKGEEEERRMRVVSSVDLSSSSAEAAAPPPPPPTPIAAATAA